MNSSGQMGSILSRLQGLKNVSGRKVMPGQELFQEPEYEETDLADTAQSPPPLLPEFNNFLPTKNEPESDMGGELTPQSYDIRANSVEPNEQELTQKPGFWDNLGQRLAEYINPKPDIREQTMNIPAQQPNEGVGFWNQLEKEATKPYSGMSVGALPNIKKAFVEQYTPNISPETYKQFPNLKKPPEIINQEQGEQKIAIDAQEILREKLEKAQKEPYTTSVYGATDIVANQPDLQEKFKVMTGMNFDDQIAEETKQRERVLEDLQNNQNQEMNGYTDQEKRINERILSNQATDADKFYIGIALLMPLLIGGLFGKEAGLGALGGAAKGVSEIYGNRQKETMKNEELLADLVNKKAEAGHRQADLDLKRLSIPQEVKKNLPKDEKAFLTGTSEVTWKDPNTGKEMVGFQIKPNLIAYPEYVTNEDEKKEMRKEAQELSTAITPVKEINKLTDDIIQISSKMEDKGIMNQALAAYLSGKNPGLATKTGEMIDYNGRKVNSYVVLEHKIKLLVDAYRQAKGMRALTNTVQDHIEGLFRNPAASFQSYEDTIDQMLYTRELAQSRLLNTVSASGFAPEHVIKDLQPEVRKTFNNLNYREGEKESSKLLKD